MTCREVGVRRGEIGVELRHGVMGVLGSVATGRLLVALRSDVFSRRCGAPPAFVACRGDHFDSYVPPAQA